jgi:hypothetical protein|tara:strand:+ start:77 stop:550 length:474 start_codon:yes stop_codon:yes gene_type:complete
LAKIKLRIGKDEIEIDSRDFYVDNQTIGKVIEDIALHLHECRGKTTSNDRLDQTSMGENDTLSSLEDVEVYEPEFSEPISIPLNELREKLLVLSKGSFFDQPRTVSETVSELREHGWIASLLDVSKTLAKMAFNKELLKNKQEDRSFYFMKEALLVN